MRRGAGDRWEAVLTEWGSGTAEIKVLIDDARWQAGGNSVVDAGGELVWQPTFE